MIPLACTVMWLLQNRFGKYSPEVFWLNLGLAKFFGPHRMATTACNTLLIAVLRIPLLFMCFCLLQKKWKLNNINLACFKLSLLIFISLLMCLMVIFFILLLL